MFKVMDESGSGIITEERHFHLIPHIGPLGRAVEPHVMTSSKVTAALDIFVLRVQKVR